MLCRLRAAIVGSLLVPGLLLAGAIAPVARASSPPTKLLVIIEENEGAGSITAFSAPYMWSMEHTYGYATDFSAVGFPSLPNYLAIAGGSTFGIHADGPPSEYQQDAPSVFGQAIKAGHTADTYAESAVGSCDMLGTKLYAVHHNPQLYFTPANERADCKADNLGFTGTSGAFASAVTKGTLPNVGMLIPNLTVDGHTPGGSAGIKNSDAWLQKQLPIIMAGADYKAGRLAIVITWDSGTTAEANKIDLIVVAPGVSHLVERGAYNDYSLSRLLSDFGGSAPLLKAATAPDMRAAMHI